MQNEHKSGQDRSTSSTENNRRATSPTKISFTKTKLESLKPQAKRYFVYDNEQANLTLMITPTGVKTFYRYGRIEGRPERLLLGRFPDLSVQQARTLCRKKAGDIANGVNPQRERRQKRAEGTFQELFAHWKESRIAEGKKEGSIKEGERILNVNLSHLKNRKLSSITKVEIQKIHNSMRSENGPYIANRALALIRAMYNIADGIGFDGANPTRGIKKFPEQSRERYLLKDELPAFFKALAKENQLFQDYFMLCLLTGARRSNVCGMAWADISLPSATWRIPGLVSKNGREMIIPLVPEAVDILLRRHDENHELENSSPWVFPGGKKNRHSHLKDPKQAWERIRENSGLKDLRIHDLRRTLGSWQAEAGVSPLIIGASLGHRSIQSTAVYARIANGSVVRESVINATSRLLEAGGANKTEEEAEADDSGEEN